MKSNVEFDSALAKFGIGLFETIKVEDKPIRLDWHMDRIFSSIESLNLDFRYEKEYLINKIEEYIRENNIQNKALRLTLFDKGYNISTRDIPYDEDSYNRGFKVKISPIKRGDSILYKHKTTNYFENIYTKNDAIKNGYDDGLFIDLESNILECSMSNIYFIKNNTIFTPKSTLPILDGTTKRRIIEICGELNLQIEEVNIKVDEIKEYEFSFISNSLMGVMKVSCIEDKKFNKSSDVFDKINKYIHKV